MAYIEYFIILPNNPGLLNFHVFLNNLYLDMLYVIINMDN